MVTSNVYDTATGQYLLIPQGARLVGKYDSRVSYGQDGVQVAWSRIIFPDASSVDLDGMDPSIAPGVAAPCPGGVTFEEARKLIHGLVRKGRVVGMDVVEITPRDDVNQITCITAGRLIVNLIGMAVRAGYFER